MMRRFLKWLFDWHLVHGPHVRIYSRKTWGDGSDTGPVTLSNSLDGWAITG